MRRKKINKPDASNKVSPREIPGPMALEKERRPQDVSSFAWRLKKLSPSFRSEMEAALAVGSMGAGIGRLDALMNDMMVSERM